MYNIGVSYLLEFVSQNKPETRVLGIIWLSQSVNICEFQKGYIWNTEGKMAMLLAKTFGGHFKFFFQLSINNSVNSLDYTRGFKVFSMVKVL